MQRELFHRGDLHDICGNRHKGNPRSVAANKKVAPKKESIREKILTLITQHPGLLHCDDIESILGLKHQTASARISELKRDFMIFISGEKKTTSGCMAALYSPTTVGFEQLR